MGTKVVQVDGGVAVLMFNLANYGNLLGRQTAFKTGVGRDELDRLLK